MTTTSLQPTPTQEPVDYDPFAEGTLSLVVPTTESQREVWLADRLGTEASLSYNLSVALTLRGKLDAEALRAALQSLVNRHEALRATVGPEGDVFCILERHVLPLPTFDFSAMDPAERRAAVAARQQAAVSRPFDLAHEPLFRAELLRLDEIEHRLLLTAHHVACDGWSWWVLIRELGVLYGRNLGFDGTDLPAPGLYTDYALSEADHQADESGVADEAFWLSRFRDIPPALELPTDRPRPALRSFASDREDVVFDAALLASLQKLGARHGSGLFATLLNGFAGLMSRLSGQNDVVIAIPAAGQAVVGQDHLVGHCVNLLPLRFDVDPMQSFASSLEAAQAQLLDALEHQRYTFGTLLKKLQVSRDPARMPLVSVMLNLDQATDQENDAFQGLAMSFETLPRRYESFEIFVNAVQSQGELHLECQYNSDLFDAATIRRWLAAYETLLRAAVEREDVAVSALPLVDADSQDELLRLQPAPTTFDRERRMHEYFEAQCDRTPGRVAASDAMASASYAELEAQANRIAQVLRQRGVHRGALVGLALDRGIDMVAALLGVLKAGAGYVPLDPAFPPDRLSYMAADAGLAALVTQSAHTGKFDLRGRPILSLDGNAEEIAAAPHGRLGRDHGAAEPEDIAYLIYTSGSTGRPKGVKVPHRAVSNFLSSMAKEPGIAAEDCLLAVTTLSFDIAVLELLLPLCVGAEVYVADRDSNLTGLLESSGATMMQATPSTWRLLVDAGWRGSPHFKALCGGEAMPPDLAAHLLDRCGSLWNLYGPTETTVWSSCARVAAGEGDAPPEIHIGRPIANTQVWILDAQGELCPLGVPGEICIGGEGVTLGYLGRPELTGERFIPDRFAPRGSAASGLTRPLLYRTGDRGRWRADGVLECFGRMDHQIKLRGYRIELGEIETNLVEREDVARAVALVREDHANDQRLVAYVVPTAGVRIDESALREHLRAVLPAYMLPQHFVVLDAIPLLPNGKIDRGSLPAPAPPPAPTVPAAPERHDEGEAEAPADPRQHYLAGVWSDLLGVRPGPDDNFFDLGGHSMLAVQMVDRVERDTGRRIKLIRLGAETLAQLAAELRDPGAETPRNDTRAGVGGRIGNGVRRLFGMATIGPKS